jgi:uncharacterized membrane protein YjgN (DUF898 family)
MNLDIPSDSQPTLSETPAPVIVQIHRFEFTGSGGEYFKIWIVNLLFTVLTLGIYSAWAKVRRMHYFYRNTRLDGANFEYHGTPMAILKGRLIAAVLFVSYTVAGNVNPLLGIAVFLLLAIVMPWLLVRSLRFQLHNSSYRGLRFAFDGNDRGAYRVFLLNVFLAAMTLYLLAPYAHQKIKQYQHRNSRFGATYFSFTAGAGSFYSIYLKVLGMIVALSIVIGIAIYGHSPLLFGLPFLFLVIMVYPAVRLPNLIWNATGIGRHRFYSTQQVLPYLWITVTNLLAIVCTLGLFVPFATVRMLRYKLEHMGLNAQGDLSNFVAGQTQDASALGEEMSSMFDVDIAL